MITIEKDHEMTVVSGAMRYYMGRQTISVWDFVQWLKAHWDELDENTRCVIKRDLDEAFEKDDRVRAAGGKFMELGADCDRGSWEEVRLLWKQHTPKPSKQKKR